MTTDSSLPPVPVELRYRFLKRHKLMEVRADVEKLADRIRAMLAAGQTAELRAFLHGQFPADIADALYYLNDAEDQAVFEQLDAAEAAELLDETDRVTLEHLVHSAPPERLAAIVQELASDEAANVVGVLAPEERDRVLSLVEPAKAGRIRTLLSYPPQSAGRMMALEYVAVPECATQAQTVQAFLAKRDGEHVFYIFTTGEQGVLAGMVDLRTLLSAPPETIVRELALSDIPAVEPETDREQVANVFAHYDLMLLPVVESQSRRLLGVITADDVIDVVVAEETEDALHMAGSDAEELEKRSPARIALMRLPWIMATMFIELLAGVVIHYFDSTLARVLLLASFMPIISAISGNTGLQSATIIVRGLSAGQIRIDRWQHAVMRQLKTTLLLGSATGLVLALIGAIWYGKWTFGLIIFIGMFMAVNIAGVVGTVVPLISKRLGFDPALTSGPFETAFQDVVGISIFLGLATVLIQYLL